MWWPKGQPVIAGLCLPPGLGLQGLLFTSVEPELEPESLISYLTVGVLGLWVLGTTSNFYTVSRDLQAYMASPVFPELSPQALMRIFLKTLPPQTL